MCGRFTLVATPKAIAETFQVPELPGLEPRYNIAPTQPVAIVRPASGEMGRELAVVHWGLIPAWADDPATGNRLINARAETAADKPSFRSPFRHRRCLVPTSGFYEWQKVDGRKQPYFIHRPDEAVFAFAGLWERWERGGEGPVESCTILTTEANEVMRPLHERMPVVLGREAWEPWLDLGAGRADLQALLRPCPESWLTVYPVSTLVNNPRNDKPECVRPLP
jgi:putative SOS response-associated peptidase YedK